jgi:hypothetical protein
MSGAFERQFTNAELRKLALDLLDAKRYLVQERSEDPKGDLCVRIAGVAIKMLGMFPPAEEMAPFDRSHITAATRWQPPVAHFAPPQTHT